MKSSDKWRAEALSLPAVMSIASSSCAKIKRARISDLITGMCQKRHLVLDKARDFIPLARIQVCLSEEKQAPLLLFYLEERTY